MPASQPLQQTKPKPLGQRREMQFAGLVVACAIVAAIVGIGRSAGDHPLSQAAQQSRLVAFQQAGQLYLVPMPPAERAEALASMNLAEQPTELRQAIEEGREPLTWLTVWDDRDEDGDVVEITSHGFSRTIRLTNAPIRIAVPIPEGGVINVRGVYDGGGGITVAISTPQGRLALPVMAVGQVLGVPVKARP